jgi:hypothetical protein
LSLSDFRQIEDEYPQHLRLPNIVCTEEAAMKIFANLIRFIYRSELPQPTAAPFDDGLAEIAQLIAREDPVEADAFPAETVVDLTTSARQQGSQDKSGRTALSAGPRSTSQPAWSR